jgi:hypothetical protein
MKSYEHHPNYTSSLRARLPKDGDSGEHRGLQETIGGLERGEEHDARLQGGKSNNYGL